MSSISTMVGCVAGRGSSGMDVLSLALREIGPNPATASPDEISAITDVPLFLGYMLSYLLQGILIVQVFVYYISFRQTDALYMKITVFAVFFVECLSVLFATIIVIMSIIKIGDLSNSIAMWGFKVLAVLCGICSTMVHAFYCWRIRILHGSWWIVAAIMTLSVVQCVMVAISGTGAFQPEYSGFLEAGTETSSDSGYLAIDVLWLAGSAVADIIIASTLLYLLRRVTAHLPLTSRTATRVERVMGAAIDTGMITAIAASIELLFFLILPDTLVHFVIFYTLPKLYANCLMATLNARLTVPGRGFRESSAEWESALPQHGVIQDAFFAPLHEKQKAPSSVEFNQEAFATYSHNSGGSSFMDIEQNFYAEVAVKRSSILGSRSIDFAHEYDGKVEQAYRARLVPATDVNLAPAASPRNNQDLALPESKRESILRDTKPESSSVSRRNSTESTTFSRRSSTTMIFDAGDVQEEPMNAPISSALTAPGLSSSTVLAESQSLSTSEPENQQAAAVIADSRASSTSTTIRLLPKIPTSPSKLEPLRAPEATLHF